MHLPVFESPPTQCLQGGFKQSITPLNLPSCWCMVRDVVHPLYAMFSSPGVYKAVLEMSPIVRLDSLRGAMPPKDLLFKAQDVFRAVA